ncbi:MAG TPA: hypothetical protein VLA49_20995 [Anaerolineales bacterium]|nr:hypothetical protein [Anaerolineales bacterium]
MSDSPAPTQPPTPGSADSNSAEQNQPRVNPYVGPRALREGERIFGRDRELRELLNRLIADRLVLLYSPSGAGKSSLVQAGLLPQMRDEKFSVLPVVRVGLEASAETEAQSLVEPGAEHEPAEFNRYVFSALLALEQDLPAKQQRSMPELAGLTFREYLAQRPRKPEEPSSRLLVFDQFEEILTQAPLDREGKQAFFEQVGEALLDHDLWALFVIREDFLAGLDPYLPLIPTYLRSTFRLDLLESQPALLAIQKPVEDQGIEFQDEAARKLVDDLSRVWVQQPDGSQREEPGLYVEPVQLQVVCRRLYRELGLDQNLHKKSITVADAARLGDVNKALAEFYGGEVSEIAVHSSISERSIRDWFAERLITENLLRGQVLMGEGSSGGLDNKVIRLLEDSHLVRAENRRNSTWFELAHDRLVRPILEDNQAWVETNLQEFQRRAAEWRRKERPNSLLLRGKDLTEAINWAEQNPDSLNERDQELLEASREWRAQNISSHQRKAAEWEQQGRPPGLLLNEAELAQAETWLLEHPDEAGPEEMQFITASREAVREEARLRQERELQLAFERQRARDQEQQNQQLRRRNIWLAALAALATLVFLVALYFAYRFNTLAGQNAARATEGALVAASNAQQRDFNATQAAQNAAESSANATEAEKNANDLQYAQVTSTAQQATAIALETQSAENAQGRATAVYNAALAQVGRLALLSQNNLGKDLPLSALLGIAAYQALPQSWEGRNALLTSLQENTQKQIRPYGTPLQTQISFVQNIVFSPDGKLLAWCGFEGKIKVWDLEKNEMFRELQIFPDHGVNTLAFSPVDDNLLVSGSNNGYLTFWDLETRQGDSVEASFRSPAGVRSAGPLLSVAFSPNGESLAVSGTFGSVQVWDVAQRQSRSVLNTGITGNVTVRKLDWSPTGDRLAGAANDFSNGLVYIWDIASQQSVDQIPTSDRFVYTLDWSPDGEFLAIAGGALDNPAYPRTILLRNTRTRQQIELTGQERNIRTLAFDQDGKILAAGSEDGVLRLWDVSQAGTNESVQPLGQPFDDFITSPPVQGLAFSPDGPNRLVYLTENNQLAIYDIGLASQLNVELAPATISQYDPLIPYDSSLVSGLLAIGYGPGDEIRTLTRQDGNLFLGSIGSTATINLWSGDVYSAALGPEDLVAAGTPGKILVWDARDGTLLREIDSLDPAISLAISPFSTHLPIHLFVSYLGEPVLVFEISSDGVMEGPNLPLDLYSMAFSPDGSILAGSSRSNIQLYGGQSQGQDLFGLEIFWDQADVITALAFSPDGNTLASGSLNGDLALWDIATGLQIGQNLRAAEAPVTGLLFAADGLSLLSAAQDGSIQRWDIDPQSWIERLCKLAGRDFEPDEIKTFFPNQDQEEVPSCKAYLPQPTATPTP